MDVREKLVELIGQAQDCGCDVSDVVEMNYVENAALADHLIAHGVTVQEWISVKDRLPDKDGETYLCLYTFPNSKEAFPYCLHWHAYGSNGFVDGPHFSDEGIAGMKVTHWMPLPQPPKGE